MYEVDTIQFPSLTSTIERASYLIGVSAGPEQPKEHASLKSILFRRMQQYDAHPPIPTNGSTGARITPQSVVYDQNSSLEALQFATATKCFDEIDEIQRILWNEIEEEDKGRGHRGFTEVAGVALNDKGEHKGSDPFIQGEGAEAVSSSSMIGSRDLAHVRTLISIVFNWGVHAAVFGFTFLWSNLNDKSRARLEPARADMTAPPSFPPLATQLETTLIDKYETLERWGTRLVQLIFPGGLAGPVSRTLITAILLDKYLPDLLRPWFILGWIPPKVAQSMGIKPVHVIRHQTMRLLGLLSPTQTINAIGMVVSIPPVLPRYATKAATGLLSAQLARPGGVISLCAVVLGEPGHDTFNESEEIPLEKYESMAKILSTLPSNTTVEEYFTNIGPAILGLLSDNMPAAYRRAAAFTLSKLLGNLDQISKAVSKIIISELHAPLLFITRTDENGEENQPTVMKSHLVHPSKALRRLIILLSNLDPAPHIIAQILSPIIPVLYSLLYYLDNIKTADPTLREDICSTLTTWGKLVSSDEGVAIIWYLVEGGKPEWKMDLELLPVRVERAEEQTSLDLLTPKEAENIDENTNILNLYPDPVHFVRFLKDVDRPDISSELFVKLLQEYKGGTRKALKSLLYLQIILQIQNQLSKSQTTSNIFHRPTHILAFIKHIFESAVEVHYSFAGPASAPNHESQTSHKVMVLLQAAEISEDNLSEAADSDDDTPGSQTIDPGDEMIETALNLLLSVLEANGDITGTTEPVLDEIWPLLDQLEKFATPEIKTLIREARLVTISRLAAAAGLDRKTRKDGGPEEIYQQALKLLQDPILPVRAHGLMLLKQLVAPSVEKKRNSDLKAGEEFEQAERLDRAYIPAILSVFLQSIHDSDSYIFLNAVQGLTTMVEGYGKEVLISLVREYAKDLDGIAMTNLTQNDIDFKLKVGEALGSTIRRCGGVLGLYVDFIAPTLIKFLRSSSIPTAIRTSALSLLSDCESAHSLAMLPYTTELVTTMIDLLQVESPGKYKQPASEQSGSSSKSSPSGPLPQISDGRPMSTNSELLPLRRAGIRFLSIIIRGTVQAMYNDSCDPSIMSPPIIDRAKTILAYLILTDDDNLIRIMAREALEMVGQMEQAQIGL